MSECFIGRVSVWSFNQSDKFGLVWGALYFFLKVIYYLGVDFGVAVSLRKKKSKKKKKKKEEHIEFHNNFILLSNKYGSLMGGIEDWDFVQIISYWHPYMTNVAIMYFVQQRLLNFLIR